MVLLVSGLADLESELSSAGDRLVVVDFYADWCPPCRAIAPAFEAMSQQHPTVKFIKVNVDNSRDIAAQFQVSAMPTFVFVKGGREMGRVRGANEVEIRRHIARFSSLSSSSPRVPAASPEEQRFLHQITSNCKKVEAYLDEINQTLALSLIPSERLIEQATVDGKKDEFLLAKALLEWFKLDFFSWVDTPTCECGVIANKDKSTPGHPTLEEEEDGASRVEVYECGACGSQVRFPRYNNPAKLLETRRGRCGEWANCFCLMAATMGFQVRWVYDVTDHVWAELRLGGRWVHCDPCENSLDQPLLYELGWGKKLTYVFAFGIDHVYDVTWRYAADHKKTKKARMSVREAVLLHHIQSINAALAAQSLPDRRKELVKHRLLEIVECIALRPRKSCEGYSARTTGSSDWRAARGEDGPSCTVKSPQKKRVVLRPNDHELEMKKFSLTYSIVSDVYTRGEGATASTHRGWSSIAHRSKDVQRKVESDWRMAYLCRKEGKAEAEIEWTVDLTGLSAARASLAVNGIAAFEGGDVTLTACADDVCMRVPAGGRLVLQRPPAALLKIKAHFSGGAGQSAFQHSQLFRASLSDAQPSLSIQVEFD